MIYSVLLSIVVVVTVLLMVTNVLGCPYISLDCQMEVDMILEGSSGSYGSKYSLSLVCCFVSAHVKHKSQAY